ncbi:MAG: hypothetical protein C4527_18135 [Candidatus Omnitrophota bacterium]|nr:MAG: hypothetical protein C4527_18135 [Candidatus Omnitrophota bacterium]
MNLRKITWRCLFVVLVFCILGVSAEAKSKRDYNGPYAGEYLNRVAFPLGGIGAGMVCLEGAGALSHVSVRNKMDIFNEPFAFSALCVKGKTNVARILEGPVPGWKVFGNPGTGNGAGNRTYGFPRFKEAEFLARFPYGTIDLKDPNVPLKVQIVGWSPFIPGDVDNSSLPVGALEYHFRNPTNHAIEAVFSFHTTNFMKIGDKGDSILSIPNGFALWQNGTEENPENEGAFAAFVDDGSTVVDHCWFRGGWFDARTLVWEAIQKGESIANPAQAGSSPGASLYTPFTVQPREEKVVRLLLCWYAPKTNIRFGEDRKDESCDETCECATSKFHIPWYAGRFGSVSEAADYWRQNFDELRKKSALFRDTFYDATLPEEVIEAAAANLTILKSPTVQRQTDGRLWCYEGCHDLGGCCHGSCTHVWNYAQAICHLFPSLERSLRQTEYHESQSKEGLQAFRAGLPIRPVSAFWGRAASDGQLGGIMKAYREWRISGDTIWLKTLWPKIKESLAYCIKTFDPREKGVLEEPHHNTYDIEFWGPDGMCSSFYLGALSAAIEMGKEMGEDVSHYQTLLEKGKQYLETQLYDGEYFIQTIATEGLNEEFKPLDVSNNGPGYEDIIQKLNHQGPKYQYGNGCISDGVLGFWLAHMCGLDGNIVDREKIRSNLSAIYKYNLKHDLSEHANPQRPSYAVGNEGGLLLCTWPKGNSLSLPFVYSNEVWTGIEYQVASHLMLEGFVREGLDIVRTCRDRYDGRIRNPFNEYECGHWYARAMSSYGMLQGLTGVRYDAVTKTLFIDSNVGKNFRSFLSTESGFGTVGLKNGKPFVEVKMGAIDIANCVVSGKAMDI